MKFGGALKDCNLQIFDKENMREIDHVFEHLNTDYFHIKRSTIGGILDIRPIRNVDYSHINNSIGNSILATMYEESNNCNEINYSLCFGLTGAMKIVRYMLSKLGSPVRIRKLNININNGIATTKDLTDFEYHNHLTILAVSTRRNNNYGHYTLVIFNKGNTYVFDPQNPRPDKHTLQILKNHGLKNIKSVYNLNKKCYNVIPHQDQDSHFCAIWSACLALLIGINHDVPFTQVFDYFGYKAYTDEYLEEKIKQFTMYLYDIDKKYNII